MKILHITDKPVLGGINTVINTLAHAQKADGFEVSYLSYFKGNENLLSREAFGHIFTLNSRFRGDPRSLHQVRKIISSLQPDVIHDHFGNLWSGTFLFKFGKPYKSFLHFHNELSVIEDSPDKRRAFRESLFKSFFIPKYDGLIAINKNSQLLLKKWYPNQNVAHIPNGISRNVVIPKRYLDQTENLHIGYIGRIVYEKGLDFVVELTDQLRKILPTETSLTITIAGEGDNSYITELKKSIRSQHLDKIIQLIGPKQNIKPLLKTFDFMIFPSRMEAFGLTILEAMNEGCPVIVIKPEKGSGPIEIVGTSFPLLFNRDPEIVALSIKTLLSNPNTIIDVLKKQEDILKKYDIRDISKMLTDWYDVD